MELKKISGQFIPQLKQGVFFPQEDKTTAWIMQESFRTNEAANQIIQRALNKAIKEYR